MSVWAGFKDFIWLKTADQTGPPVVWIRIGNAVRRILIARLTIAWFAHRKWQQGEGND